MRDRLITPAAGSLVRLFRGGGSWIAMRWGRETKSGSSSFTAERERRF